MVYCNDNQWIPDYIFLASGTGSTQAGIISGLDATVEDSGFTKPVFGAQPTEPNNSRKMQTQTMRILGSSDINQ